MRTASSHAAPLTSLRRGLARAHRSLAFAGLVLLGLAPQGCMALGARAFIVASDPSPEMNDLAFVGTRADVDLLEKSPPASDLASVGAKTLLVLDVPLSIAMDTVLLPVDAITAAVK